MDLDGNAQHAAKTDKQLHANPVQFGHFDFGAGFGPRPSFGLCGCCGVASIRLIISSRRRSASSSDGSSSFICNPGGNLERFDQDTVSGQIWPACREAMLDVILAWAKLDSSLSLWLVSTLGLQLDDGAILVENMDLENKLNRLKRLFAHRGMTPVVTRIASLKKDRGNRRQIDLVVLADHFADQGRGQASSTARALVRIVILGAVEILVQTPAMAVVSRLGAAGP